MRITKRENLLLWSLSIFSASFTAIAIALDSMVFFVPLLLLVLLGWIHFATRYPAIALIVVIVLVEEGLDIFTFGIRQRYLSDIGMALMLPIIILNIPRVWNHISKERSPYSLAILLFFGAILISLYFGSHEIFGQPMSVGLTVARKHLQFASYFFMVALGASLKECFRFMKYLAWLGAAIAFLSIVDVALGGGVIFSYYFAVGQERAGMLRIHVGTFLVIYSIIYSFVKCQHLPQSSKQRLGYLLLLALGLYTIVFIVMTRAVFLGLLLVFIFWMAHKITSRKIRFVCAIVSLLAIFFLSGMGDVMLSKTFVGKIINETTMELVSDKGNISIRQKGAQHYLELVLEDAPLTGIGVFSETNYPNNPVTNVAELYNYYIIDINGISTVIHFGLQGLMLLAFLIIKSLRDSNLAMRNASEREKYNYEVLFFLFIYTIATPTLNNIIVERMVIYTGIFFYLLSQTNVKGFNFKREPQ